MKVLLDWIAAVAWPAAVLTIAIMYRNPIYDLLHHLSGIAARAATQPFKATVGSLNLEFKEAVIARNPKSIQDAVDVAADVAKHLVPEGFPVPGKPHVVASPFDYGKFVDVEGFAPGTEVKDPYTGKIFRVPQPRI
jgi:hypothetical protein